jgi:hypothetical protein
LTISTPGAIFLGIDLAHFFLTNQNDKNFNNGAVLTLSAIIKHVMLSASEAVT